MEGKVTSRSLAGLILSALLFFSTALSLPISACAQESTPSGQAEITLRKSANSRVYQGREVEGEDRQIGPGDSLWRILVIEKGLPGQKFPSYLIVVRGLNPQIKNLDVLRVGDKIFLPLRPDQMGEGRPVGEVAGDRGNLDRAGTTNYRVKPGEHLYQILREQLKLTDERKVAQYHALVKDLNPERKNLDALVEGDIIRLPTLSPGTQRAAAGTVADAAAKKARETVAALETKSKAELKPVPETRGAADSKTVAGGADKQPAAGAPAIVAAEPKVTIETKAVPEKKSVTQTRPLAVAADRQEALRAPAKENFALFTKVVEAIGSQVQQTGEEVIAIRDGSVRFDKNTYPVIYNPALRQKVVIDPDGKIPPSLRTKLADPAIGAPIVPMANGVSIQDVVSQLLTGLGYQALPADRPVTIQEDGITFEARGSWIALAPEQNNRTQEVYVISLTDDAGEIPDYLRAQLEKNGLHLKDVLLPSPGTPPTPHSQSVSRDFMTQVKTWPRDKKEIVDALLLAYGVPFGVAETLSVELQDGLRIDTRTDRIFELGGKRTALFFQRPDAAITKTLQEKQGVRTVDLDLNSLSSRELITKVLTLLGDHSVYREHRFPAANGANKERVTLTAWGFHLPRHSMFVTDRPIPSALHRFFFEKGLEIVYFQ
jgi:hypothetical protein